MVAKETPDVRNCIDDNCNLKIDEPNALPCCDPGTLGESDLYKCGQTYPVIAGMTPPPGKKCSSDNATFSACIDGSCYNTTWSYTSACSNDQAQCAGLLSCIISPNPYPLYNASNTCKVSARMNYLDLSYGYQNLQVIIPKLRGAACGLGCAKQTGCFGTYYQNTGMVDSNGNPIYAARNCSTVPYAQCGLAILYDYDYTACTKDPIICARPDAGRCANDGGPCTDPALLTNYTNNNGVCDYGESCTAPDCAARGWNVTCTTNNTCPPGTVQNGQTCTPLALNACDKDGDGYNGTYPGCANPNDCNDNDSSIHPNAPEDTPLLCTDGLDNDCNGNIDYDGYTSGTINPPVHGDQQCPVTITSIDAPFAVFTNTAFTINCAADAVVRSLTLNGTGLATTFDRWSGTGSYTAVFNASITTPGTYTVTCSVDHGMSYQAGTDRTTTITASNATVTWEGHVRDVNGQPITDATPTTLIDNADPQPTTTDTSGRPSYINRTLTPGLHNVTANATGYEQRTILNVPFTTNPTRYDISLRAIQCQRDCTYNGVCDYNCLQDPASGCTLNASLSAAEKASILNICQYATPGSTRIFNTTTTITCCKGPLSPTTQYQTPMTLSSCADNLITHKTGVIMNGKLVQLTVVSYDKCN